MQSLNIQEKANILIKNIRLVDPVNKMDQTADILIKNGIIEKIGSVKDPSDDALILDGSNKTIIPGLFDMHVHLREPGQEDKETIHTGCLAAASGGFTEVCAMPNTIPALDNRGLVDCVPERAKSELVRVHPIAAITKGRKGKELTEMGELAEAGVPAFTDDGSPVNNSGTFRRALEYASMFNTPIIEHAEDVSLSAGGSMHEGLYSTCLGIPPIPDISESVAVARDIQIAEFTQTQLHIAHISTAKSVRLIREAKARGVQVTAETCPHYLVLTDEAVQSFDPNFKMNPPLRSKADQQALIEALIDGTLDVIATDHAPHTIDDKDCEFDIAAFGITGLETAVGIILTHFVHKNKLTLEQFIEKMAINPRKILHLPVPAIKKGEAANLTILDEEALWHVDKTMFLSKGKNTPFNGWPLQGRSVGVIRQQKIYVDKDVFAE